MQSPKVCFIVRTFWLIPRVQVQLASYQGPFGGGATCPECYDLRVITPPHAHTSGYTSFYGKQSHLKRYGWQNTLISHSVCDVHVLASNKILVYTKVSLIEAVAGIAQIGLVSKIILVIHNRESPCKSHSPTHYSLIMLGDPYPTYLSPAHMTYICTLWLTHSTTWAYRGSSTNFLTCRHSPQNWIKIDQQSHIKSAIIIMRKLIFHYSMT